MNHGGIQVKEGTKYSRGSVKPLYSPVRGSVLHLFVDRFSRWVITPGLYPHGGQSPLLDQASPADPTASRRAACSGEES